MRHPEVIGRGDEFPAVLEGHRRRQGEQVDGHAEEEGQGQHRIKPGIAAVIRISRDG